MRLSILLAEQIGILFLVAFIGYMIVKFNILREEDSKVISWLVAFVLSPCVIIKSFQIDFTPEKLKGLALAVAAAVAAQVIYLIGTRLLMKPLHLTPIERASVIYSNCGNLIVPLVTFVLGEEWVFYTCAYMMVSTVMTWTHLQSLLSGGEDGGNLKKIILNPNIIAIAIGLILFFTGIRIPEVLESTIEGFGGAIGPVSMLVVGMLIGNMDLKWVFTRKRPYLISVLRLVAFPVIAAVLFAFIVRLKIHPDAGYILLVSLLAASAPAAVMVTQLTQIYNGDARYASVINVMSVIFCIITMPLVVLLFEVIC
ncbi:MAG: AEC family transporter [Eubacteriales bacterium]|nr:AEC family transporter [Eubacteriales bacterium]